MEIAAGQFKTQCLKLIDQVKQTREEIVITKHGRPIAKLVPMTEGASRSIIGFMKGSVKVTGDIVRPLKV